MAQAEVSVGWDVSALEAGAQRAIQATDSVAAATASAEQRAASAQNSAVAALNSTLTAAESKVSSVRSALAQGLVVKLDATGVANGARQVEAFSAQIKAGLDVISSSLAEAKAEFSAFGDGAKAGGLTLDSSGVEAGAAKVGESNAAMRSSLDATETKVREANRILSELNNVVFRVGTNEARAQFSELSTDISNFRLRLTDARRDLDRGFVIKADPSGLTTAGDTAVAAAAKINTTFDDMRAKVQEIGGDRAVSVSLDSSGFVAGQRAINESAGRIRRDLDALGEGRVSPQIDVDGVRVAQQAITSAFEDVRVKAAGLRDLISTTLSANTSGRATIDTAAAQENVRALQDSLGTLQQRLSDLRESATGGSTLSLGVESADIDEAQRKFAELSDQLSDKQVSVGVVVDSGRALAEVDRAVESIQNRIPQLRLAIDTAALETGSRAGVDALNSLEQEAASVREQIGAAAASINGASFNKAVEINIDAAPAQQQIQALEGSLNSLREHFTALASSQHLEVTADTSGLDKALAQLEALGRSLAASREQAFDLNTGDAREKLSSIQAELDRAFEKLNDFKSSSSVTVAFDPSSVKAGVDRAIGSYAQLGEAAVKAEAVSASAAQASSRDRIAAYVAAKEAAINANRSADSEQDASILRGEHRVAHQAAFLTQQLLEVRSASDAASAAVQAILLSTNLSFGAAVGGLAAVEGFKVIAKQIEETRKADLALQKEIARPLSIQVHLDAATLGAEIETTEKLLRDLEEKRGSIGSRIREAAIQGAPDIFNTSTLQVEPADRSIPEAEHQREAEERLHALVMARADAELRVVDVKEKTLHASEREGTIAKANLDFDNQRAKLFEDAFKPGGDQKALFERLAGLQKERDLTIEVANKKAFLAGVEIESSDKIASFRGTEAQKVQLALDEAVRVAQTNKNIADGEGTINEKKQAGLDLDRALAAQAEHRVTLAKQLISLEEARAESAIVSTTARESVYQTPDERQVSGGDAEVAIAQERLATAEKILAKDHDDVGAKEAVAKADAQLSVAESTRVKAAADIATRRKDELDAARAGTAQLIAQSTGHEDIARLIGIRESAERRVVDAIREGNAALADQAQKQGELGLVTARAEENVRRAHLTPEARAQEDQHNSEVAAEVQRLKANPDPQLAAQINALRDARRAAEAQRTRQIALLETISTNTARIGQSSQSGQSAGGTGTTSPGATNGSTPPAAESGSARANAQDLSGAPPITGQPPGTPSQEWRYSPYENAPVLVEHQPINAGPNEQRALSQVSPDYDLRGGDFAGPGRGNIGRTVSEVVEERVDEALRRVSSGEAEPIKLATGNTAYNTPGYAPDLYLRPDEQKVLDAKLKDQQLAAQQAAPAPTDSFTDQSGVVNVPPSAPPEFYKGLTDEFSRVAADTEKEFNAAFGSAAENSGKDFQSAFSDASKDSAKVFADLQGAPTGDSAEARARDQVSSPDNAGDPSLPDWSELQPELPDWSGLIPAGLEDQRAGAPTGDSPEAAARDDEGYPPLPDWSELRPDLPDWSYLMPTGVDYQRAGGVPDESGDYHRANDGEGAQWTTPSLLTAGFDFSALQQSADGAANSLRGIADIDLTNLRGLSNLFSNVAVA